MQASHTSRVGRQWLLATAAAIVLAACSSVSDPDLIHDPPTNSIDLRGTVVTSVTGFPSDPITIDSAHVVGDTLAATVSHGGCSTHMYRLVISSQWMESNPVQVRARISHKAKNEYCRMLVRRTLRMSLRPLADAYRAAYRQEHGSVLIQLSGASKTLLYIF